MIVRQSVRVSRLHIRVNATVSVLRHLRPVIPMQVAQKAMPATMEPAACQDSQKSLEICHISSEVKSLRAFLFLFTNQQK